MSNLYATSPQFSITQCQFCGGVETRERPFVAVLTNFKRSERHILHAGSCHDGHSARIKAEREGREKEREKAA